MQDDEIVRSIEALAIERARRQAAHRAANPGIFDGFSDGLMFDGPREVCIGHALCEAPPPRAEIAGRLLDRYQILRKEKPGDAIALWDILVKWPDAAIDAFLLQRMTAEPLDETVVKSAVARAGRLGARQGAGLNDLAKRGGERGGLAAALLGNDKINRAILTGHDAAAQQMLLAAARLGRVPLPVDVVDALVPSPDARTSRAAQRYLISEDGPIARRLIQARHRGEMLVLGAEWSEFPEDPPQIDLDRFDQPFREEMLGKDAPDDIYIFLGCVGLSGESQQITLRFRGNTAIMEVQPWNTAGKSLTRPLAADECRQFRDFIERNHVDDLPQLYTGVIDGTDYSYLHLNRAGGRRISLPNVGESGTAGSPHYRLKSLFQYLADGGPYATSYPKLQQAIPGMRIVFSDVSRSIDAVVRQGQQVCVGFGAFNKLSWRVLRDGKIAEAAPRPAGFVPTFRQYGDVPTEFSLQTPNEENRWKAMVGDAVICTGIFSEKVDLGNGSYTTRDKKDSGGLFRWEKPQLPQRISKLAVSSPVATYDGKWVVVTGDKALVRIELSTAKAFDCDLPAGRTYVPQLWLPVLDRMLVEESGDDKKNYWLLDPITGKANAIKAEPGPLLKAWGRLQPSSIHKDEVWLTTFDVYEPQTQIIRYNLHAFTWRTVLTVPTIGFSNDHFVIDEDERSALVAINGDLLRIPLARAEKE